MFRFQVCPLTTVVEKYRLVWFKSSPPEEMFASKIRFQEYGDALLLARTYEYVTLALPNSTY